MSAVAEAPETVQDIDAEIERLKRKRQSKLPASQRGMRRFRLLCGTHYQKEIVGKNPDGSNKVEVRGYAVLYATKEAEAKGIGNYYPVVTPTDSEGNPCNQDLIKIHNKFGYAPKWAEVQDGEEDQFAPRVDLGPLVAARPSAPMEPYTPGAVPPGLPVTASTEDTLSAMNEKDLRQLAADEEIDVSKCKSKADLLKTIRMVVQSSAKV